MDANNLLNLIRQNHEVWNKWRKQNPEVHIDFTGADLSHLNLSNFDLHKVNFAKANLYNTKLLKADLRNANFSGADLHQNDLTEATIQGAIYIETNLSETNLKGADLEDANLSGANLSGADLTNADLYRATLYKASLFKATLCEADLSEANLYRADLREANLTGASIRKVNLVEVEIEGAVLTNSFVYGISAWGIIGEPKDQSNLTITPLKEAVVTVDDLVVSQFIYLLLNNKNLRNVLNSITSKGVLILGRFNDSQRKDLLDSLKEKLRNFDLLPIVFDFDRPTGKDYTETVQTLAGMSKFVIVDVTDPRSVPLELEALVKQFKIPYVPIIDIRVDSEPFSMLADLQKSYHWVFPTLGYESKDDLLDDESLQNYIIDPVNKKREELRKNKNDEPETIIIRKRNINTGK